MPPITAPQNPLASATSDKPQCTCPGSCSQCYLVLCFLGSTVFLPREKLHWEEEVIGPVIFGNNYDPLQEVIINGEGKGRTGEEGTVGSNRVCKEVAWKCAYPLLLHTHSLGSGQCAWPCLAPRSQKHSFASFHVDSESKLCV